MRRLRPLAASVGFLALALLALAAVAATRERRFFNARQGVGVEAPVGWTLSQHTGYPEILVVLLHPDGSRISLSAAPTTASDARALVEQSRRGLEAQHLAIARVAPRPARRRARRRARRGPRRAELRQLYLVRPAGAGKRQAVVLTLSTRAETLAAASPAFDAVVARLQLEAARGRRRAPPGRLPDAGPRARP